MAYTRVNWENYPSTNTPINEDNLNNMDNGIYQNDLNIATLQSTVSNLQIKVDSLVDGDEVEF